MSDKDLIELICEIWIQNGGDAEGFSWVWGKILERLKALEAAFMMVKGRFEQGQQPCSKFDPEDQYVHQGFTHQCYRCETGSVVFCKNCCRDHHEWGYETCKKGESDETRPAV